MKYVLETFRRTSSDDQAIELGTTRLILRDRELALMAKLEKRLCRINQSEIAVDINPDDIQMDAPASCGALKDCRLQLVFNMETHSSSFHVAARQASDNSIVYTDSVKMPLTATKSATRLTFGGLLSAAGA